MTILGLNGFGGVFGPSGALSGGIPSGPGEKEDPVEPRWMQANPHYTPRKSDFPDPANYQKYLGRLNSGMVGHSLDHMGPQFKKQVVGE